MASGGWNLLSSSSSSSSSSDDDDTGKKRQPRLHADRPCLDRLSVLEKDLKELLERNDNVHGELTRQKERHARWKERRGRHRSYDKDRSKGADTVLTQVDKQCQQQEKQVSRLYSLLESLLDIQKTALHCVENLSASTGPGSQPTVSGRQSHSHKHPTSDTKHREPEITQRSTDGGTVSANQVYKDERKDRKKKHNNASTVSENVTWPHKSLSEAEIIYCRKLRCAKTSNYEDNRLTLKFQSSSGEVDADAGGCEGAVVMTGSSNIQVPEKSAQKERPGGLKMDHSMTGSPTTQKPMTSTGSQHGRMLKQLPKPTKPAVSPGSQTTSQSDMVLPYNRASRSSSVSSDPDPNADQGLPVDFANDFTRHLDEWLNPQQTEIPVDMWVEWADQEVIKGTENTVKLRVNQDFKVGIHTLLMIDISDSMKGDNWTFIKHYIKEYLECGRKEDETFAILTFGHETRVAQQFTQDYELLAKTVDEMTPSGPTPLYGSLLLCHGALKGGGQTVELGLQKLMVTTRVVLLTDGRLTGETITGSDRAPFMFDFVQHKARIVNKIEQLFHVYSTRFYVIPVGNYDEEFLQQIAEHSEGIFLKAEIQQKQLMRSAQNYRIAASSFMPVVLEDAKTLLRIQNPEVTDLDMQDITSFQNEHLQWLEERKDVRSMPGFQNMPPAGMRVRRGPEWREAVTDDGEGPGTIIGLRTDGFVRVHWDVTDVKGIYPYGRAGQYAVIIVEEPRVLKDGELIKVGCCVKRGTDWDHEEQDGGAGTVGIVIKVFPCRVVTVRWPNGRAFTYNFGHDNVYEVEVCDPPKVPQTTLPGIPAERPSGLFVPHTKPLPAPMSSVPVYTVTSAPSANSPATPTSRENTPVTSASGEGTLPMPGTPGFSVSKPSIQLADPVVSSVSKAVRPGSGINRSATSVISPTFGATASAVTGTTFSAGATMSVTTASPLGKPPVSHPTAGNGPTPPAILTPSRPIPSLGQDSGPGFQPDQGTVRNSPGNCQWQFKTKAGWKNYSADVCKSLDACYWQSPKTTAIFYIGGQPYKAIPEKMKVVHLPTKKALDIQRLDV